MKCPYCNNLDSRVLDSRPLDNGNVIRRRRECISCQKRFTTHEHIEIGPIFIVKKDGRREPFDRGKIMSGLIKACEKRPIGIQDIENIVSDIEKDINNSLMQEVTSEAIGEMVMDRLRSLDQVAYVRFASVYREFTDINNFIKELEQIKKEG